MYNKTILQGNLTRDVEIRYTQGGTAVGNTGIAINRRYKTQSGEQKEDVLFIDLTLFGRTAEVAHQYLRKGSGVLVDGRLTLEQWEAQDGAKRSRHVVIVENLQMLGGNENKTPPETNVNGAKIDERTDTNTKTAQGQENGNKSQNQANMQPALPELEINEDDIPF